MQICADATARIEALGEPESAGELASVTEDAVAINDKALASIRALGPPAEIEEQVSPGDRAERTGKRDRPRDRGGGRQAGSGDGPAPQR